MGFKYSLATPKAQEEQALDAAIAWAEQSVIRLLVTRGLPLLLSWGVFNGGLAWLQGAIGLNLPKSVVAGWVISMLAGGVVALGAFVLNHGRGAAAVLSTIIAASKVTLAEGQAAVGEVTGGELAGEPSTEPTVDEDESPHVGATAGTPPLAPADDPSTH